MRAKVTAIEQLNEKVGKVKVEGPGEDGYTNMFYVYLPLDDVKGFALGDDVEVRLTHVACGEDVGNDSFETYQRVKEAHNAQR